ncbi:MAG: hypothetical protein IT381_07540 [Deltaproteobacteria bacterium]|nr:hypothetical protein [Deltaproteobacteria bacterium]
MATARPKKRITDAHGNFIEKKRWTKKRALMEAAKKAARGGSDGFAKADSQPQKVAAQPARASFGQRNSAMLSLLTSAKPSDKGRLP